MRGRMLVFCMLVICCAVAASQMASNGGCTSQEVAEWIRSSLTQMEKIQVGMTRTDVERLFMPDGGISSPDRQTFVFHNCPYIKVDVEFAATRDADGRLVASFHDRITRISKPYLAQPTFD